MGTIEKISVGEIANILGLSQEVSGAIDSLCTDSREAVPGSLFVAIPGERVNGHDYIGAALEKGAVCALAQEPGPYPPGRVLMVENTLDALLKVSAHYRKKFSARVVGVTGSVGKTTTKDMVAAVAGAKYNTIKTQGNQNNEIGMPRTLFSIDRATEVAVVEMGMSGLGEIRELALAAKPDMGVITNIGVSHLEHLGTRENILKAKLELADCLPDGAPLFLCKDNDLLAGVRIPRLETLFYSLEDRDCLLYGEMRRGTPVETHFVIHWEGKAFPAAVPGTGKHLVLNALAAFGVGQRLGISSEECVRALAEYRPSDMRQKIVDHRGVIVVEDCYNASPDSVKAAADAVRDFPCVGKKIMVLSDMLELGDIARESHREMGRLVAGSGANHLLAWGELAGEYADAAKEVGMENATYYKDKEEMAKALVALAGPGDLVWVKGSRGMKLEEVITFFYSNY